MPGNAFQRNAFQRNAFQIIYDFVAVPTGGVIVGGSVTASFEVSPTNTYEAVTSGGIIVSGETTALHRESHDPVTTGGVIVSGEVFGVHTEAHPSLTSGGVIVSGEVHGHFQLAGSVNYDAITSGGVIVGGEVIASFTPGQPSAIGGGGGGTGDRRLWQVIWGRIHPNRYKPVTSGGIVAGGSVEAESFETIPDIIYVQYVAPNVYLARPTGVVTVVVGGEVEAVFHPASPPDNLVKFRYIPPQPLDYTPVASGGRGVGGGVLAAFRRAPALVDFRAARLRKQIEEEDELLLLGVLDE